MLKNYIKIAFRQLWKQKLFSALNIFGLATSMSVCLLLIMILADQYGYDAFHEKGDRIYRVISASEDDFQPQEPKMATTSLELAMELKEEYPFVESVVRILPIDATVFIDQKQFKSEVDAHIVDQSFLDAFSFGWTTGEQRTALLNPRSVVLTESTAKRFFPFSDPLGATISLKDLGDYTVTGILPDPPRRSHITFDYLISYATVEVFNEEESNAASIYEGYHHIWRGLVYLSLKEGTTQERLDNALADVGNAYTQKSLKTKFLFVSQALLEINPSKDLSNDIGKTTPEIIFFFLMALGLIIMCAACFNYTSLSIARSLKRVGEIGVRKVIGARKKDIIIQFLGEAILLAFVSLLVAIGLLEFLIPVFYNLDPDMDQYITLERTPQLYLIFFGFSILVGLLAGLLPALNIARLQPIHAIQKLSNLKLVSRSTIQKVLVTVQFALSLIFVLAVIVLMQQKNHVLNADYGIQIQNIYNVKIGEADYELFAQKARQILGVEEVSASNLVLLTHSTADRQVHFNSDQDSMNMNYNAVSPNYLQTMNIELLAGSNLPNTTSTSEQFVLVNKKAIERMGLPNPEAAIGQSIRIDSNYLSIVGVTNDFHHNSVWFDPVRPFALRQNIDQPNYANIRLSDSYTAETLTAIRSAWKEVSPMVSMDHRNSFFMEDQVFGLAKFFRMGSHIIGFIGFLSILIACMGLLGMVIYTVEGKLKEVSIRKVLGASKGNIIWQLSKGFFVLLSIAILIATPLIIFGANIWLENFVTRISLGPMIVLIGIGIVLLLGMITVVSQTYLAARSNPVDSLRSE